jgi:N-acetylmuramoyl-L-alanine amidase
MIINKKSFVSPNFQDRVDPIDMIIIHSTHMPTLPSLERLCSGDALVSCHYLIDLDGNIYQLVEEDKVAWHAGVSYWSGRAHLNKYSIGIEMVDRFDDGNLIKEFSEIQICHLIELLIDIVRHYKIKPQNILAHSDVAPDRKDDPGEIFPWDKLASHSIGLYPGEASSSRDGQFMIRFGDEGENVRMVQELLQTYGYKISVDSIFGQETKEVIIAFKRHFDSRNIDPVFDSRSLEIIKSIIDTASNF